MKQLLIATLCLILWGSQAFAQERPLDKLDEVYLTYVLSSPKAKEIYDAFNDKYFPAHSQSPAALAHFILDKSFTELPRLKTFLKENFDGARFFRELSNFDGKDPYLFNLSHRPEVPIDHLEVAFEAEKLALDSMIVQINPDEIRTGIFKRRLIDPAEYRKIDARLAPLREEFDKQVTAITYLNLDDFKSRAALNISERLLKAQGINFLTTTNGNLWHITISTTGNAPLNLQAKRWGKKGKALIFDPYLLARNKAAGSLIELKKALYISTQAVAFGSDPDVIFHEILHAVCNDATLKGYNSLIRGIIASSSPYASGWLYGKGLYVNELATYALSLRILIRNYSFALRSRGPSEQAFIRRAFIKTLYFSALVAEQIQLVTERLLKLQSENKLRGYDLNVTNMNYSLSDLRAEREQDLKIFPYGLGGFQLDMSFNAHEIPSDLQDLDSPDLNVSQRKDIIRYGRNPLFYQKIQDLNALSKIFSSSYKEVILEVEGDPQSDLNTMAKKIDGLTKLLYYKKTKLKKMEMESLFDLDEFQGRYTAQSRDAFIESKTPEERAILLNVISKLSSQNKIARSGQLAHYLRQIAQKYDSQKQTQIIFKNLDKIIYRYIDENFFKPSFTQAQFFLTLAQTPPQSLKPDLLSFISLHRRTAIDSSLLYLDEVFLQNYLGENKIELNEVVHDITNFNSYLLKDTAGGPGLGNAIMNKIKNLSLRPEALSPRLKSSEDGAKVQSSKRIFYENLLKTLPGGKGALAELNKQFPTQHPIDVLFSSFGQCVTTLDQIGRPRKQR